MQHTAAKVKVYQTTEYKRFTNIEGNRPLNKKKIERIINDIKNGNDILDEVPVLVQENKTSLHVLDGQHRVEIAKQLKRPVHYIIHKVDMSMYDLAKVNSNTEKWTSDNFINAYIKAGNKHYEKLKEFVDKYGISVGVSVTLLETGTIKSDGGAKHDCILNFQQGVFQVKHWKEACAIAEICQAFAPFTGIAARPFIIAIARIIDADKCEMDVLIEKFKKNPLRLVQKHRWKEYLTLLQEIYNTGNSKQRPIY